MISTYIDLLATADIFYDKTNGQNLIFTAEP